MSGQWILFVCTGNTCRSPMAEYLFRYWAGPKSAWKAASAGVSAFSGISASPSAIALLKERGVDASKHRSQPVTREWIDRAGLIVVMTRDHREILRRQFPDAAEKIVLLTSFGERKRPADIDDPAGYGPDVYRKVMSDMDDLLPDFILALHERFGKTNRPK